MNCSVFSEYEWLYPDSPPSAVREIQLEGARGAYVGCQLLGGEIGQGEALSCSVRWTGEALPQPVLFQMIDVGVPKNSDPVAFTTLDYASCADYVTRQAPFRVYDALRPLSDGPTRPGRLALYLRFRLPAGQKPGTYTGMLTLTAGAQIDELPVSVTLHAATIPSPGEGRLGMINCFHFQNICEHHGVDLWSEEYWALYRKYAGAQAYLRCTYVMLPAPVPVYDASGVLTGFDFTHAVRTAQIAMEEGVRMVCGAHLAHWITPADVDYVLGWNKQISALSLEGYLQLSIYLRQWAEIIRENGWEGRVVQALADEPQENNGQTYRQIAAICRKFLPGVPIMDAVETCNLGGAIDYWVLKQDNYEVQREAFEKLRRSGELLWYYTCAFPGGKIMNRTLDLPLLVSREILWMGFGYNLSGFLHWGFNFHRGKDIWTDSCAVQDGQDLPPGDAHVVYAGNNCVWHSLRLEAQRAGAEEYELLSMIAARDEQKAHAISNSVCRSFRDYTRDPKVFDAARHELLLEASKS